MKRVRRILAKILRPWIATVVVNGLFPAKIGRYRVLDVLVVWVDEEGL